MTKYMEKSFTVPMMPRETEEQEYKRKGYEKRKGYWLKSKIPTELLAPAECGKCGKSRRTGLSKLDAVSMDDWSMCKECYIYNIEGREKILITQAISAIIDTEQVDDDIAKGAMSLLDLRGAKRWIKNNWPDKYDLIYNDKDEE